MTLKDLFDRGNVTVKELFDFERDTNNHVPETIKYFRGTDWGNFQEVSDNDVSIKDIALDCVFLDNGTKAEVLLKEEVKIKNVKVFITTGMFCGTDNSDLLDPEVFETREGARKALIETIIGAGYGAELFDENGELLEKARIMVYARSLDEPDDSIRDLKQNDERIPHDVSRIILKDYDLDEYWQVEITERRVA